MEEYLLVVLMKLCESLRQLSYIDMHDYFFVYFVRQKYPKVKTFLLQTISNAKEVDILFWGILAVRF